MLSKGTALSYVQSPEGKGMSQLFTVKDEFLVYDQLDEIYERFAYYLSPLIENQEEFYAHLNAVILSILETIEDDYLDDAENYEELFIRLIEKFQLYGLFYHEIAIDTNKVLIKKGDLRGKLSLLPMISLALYQLYDTEIFYPILFSGKENLETFLMWCSVLDIEVPDTPLKEDYAGWFQFYIDLCSNINKHRKELEVSVSQMCALLYGYAKGKIEEGASRNVVN